MLWNIVNGTASLLDKQFLIILGVYLKLLIIKLKLKKNWDWSGDFYPVYFRDAGMEEGGG